MLGYYEVAKCLFYTSVNRINLFETLVLTNNLTNKKRKKWMAVEVFLLEVGNYYNSKALIRIIEL